jgi:6-pyruvoyltetrahydropterin/6-carboxytetrahydropterin synthase
VYGHTYTLHLHLSAPLVEIMGWTVDFGDVKEVFTPPLFKMLDHKPRYEIPDLAECDTASIANWVLAKARTALPQLYRVDFFETRGCGVLVSTGQDGPQLPL